MECNKLKKVCLCGWWASALAASMFWAAPLKIPRRQGHGVPGNQNQSARRSILGRGERTARVSEELQRSRLNQAYGKLPLTFEQNVGQVSSDVRFLSRGPGYNLFLTSDEAVLVLKKNMSKGKRQTANVAGGNYPEGRLSIVNRQSSIVSLPAVREVLKMKLAGANPHATLTGLDELQGKSNYLIGSDPNNWRTRVAQYAKVKYENIYSGVDLVYYGNPSAGGKLEYDFVVAPGADPGLIRINVGASLVAARGGRPQGAPLRIDSHGDLTIEADGGEIRFHKPVVYQNKSTVDSSQLTVKNENQGSKSNSRHSPPVTRHFLDGRYVLRALNRKSQITNRQYEITFQIDQYDHSLPLVIDPVLSYSTYLGGSNFDYAYGIAVDSAGNAYVTGATDSLDFPEAGPIQGSGGGTCTDDLKSPFNCFDAFVAKLNPAGTALIYSTFLGGSNDDRGAAIAVDSSGNAYVTGYTVSSDFPTVNAFQSVFGGGNCGSPSNSPCYDAFVAKLNAAGSALIYSSYLGGGGNDLASGISVDSFGAAYIVGSTASSNFPVTSSPVQAVYGGGAYNAFVTKLNPGGNTAAYSTYLGGQGEDHGAAVAVDSSGNAYVTGYTISNNFPTKFPLQISLAGGTCGTTPCFDAFVTKLNPAGSALVYSTYMGGTGGDYGYGIALDSAGDAYVSGLTTSTNFPVTSGAFQTVGGGVSYDAFVFKLNPTGSALDYSTYLGGLGSDVAYAIAVDPYGSAYVAGYSYGQGFPVASPLQSSGVFLDDAFITKINASGSALIFSTYLGGSGNDVAQGIAVDPLGSVYVAGGTFSTDFPVTPGALRTTYGGGAYNAFVSKISGINLPVTTLSQINVLFASQGVDTTSLPTTVNLANNGDAALNIFSITANGDFAVTGNCGTILAPGGSCNLSITFTPTDYGSRTGTVNISDNAWKSPHLINLTGGGITSVTVGLSPSLLSFGNQPVGTTSASLPATLKNLGSVTLNVYSISAGPGFNQTNNCPGALPAGASCTLLVAFSPTAAGLFAVQINISDNASAGNPNSINLTGTGTGPAASLSSTSLVFSDQYLSTASAQQTLTLTSSGSSVLKLSGIANSGPFAQTNNCGGSLPVGASCHINVTFTPITAGTSTGSLVIYDNALGSFQTVALFGNGTVPPHQIFGLPLKPHGKH
ncbi:MAG TPA: SBBP repeat-containing protein [Terriglobia bacterium]|nr:SBBP repeat-containing protein [Terriglobia bacterium]